MQLKCFCFVAGKGLGIFGELLANGIVGRLAGLDQRIQGFNLRGQFAGIGFLSFLGFLAATFKFLTKCSVPLCKALVECLSLRRHRSNSLPGSVDCRTVQFLEPSECLANTRFEQFARMIEFVYGVCFVLPKGVGQALAFGIQSFDALAKSSDMIVFAFGNCALSRFQLGQ